jgi:hypothetical protein
MRTVAELSAAVAGGAVTYVIFGYVADESLAIRVAVAVAVVSLGIAWFARRRSQGSDRSHTTVAHDVRARGNLSVTDVEVTKPANEIAVGRHLRSKGSTTIKGVRIGDRDDRNDDT